MKGDDSMLQRSVARSINRISNKLRRRLDALSSRGDFSGAQGKTLHFLLAQPGDVFQKDVEEEYGIRSSTATELLKQMEKNGLITRQPMPYDNRLKKIILTPKALAYREQVVRDVTEIEDALTKGIDPSQLEIFFAVLEKMMDNLSE